MSSLGMRALHTVPLLCSTSSFFNPLKLQQIISTLPAFIFFVFLREFTISLCSCQGTVVGSSGLEPPTSRLSGARSNQLSYEPFFTLPVCWEVILTGSLTYTFCPQLFLLRRYRTVETAVDRSRLQECLQAVLAVRKDWWR